MCNVKIKSHKLSQLKAAIKRNKEELKIFSR